MALSQERLLAILAWVVIVLIAGPVGGAVFMGLVYGESPCILCWAQRTSMVLIALVGLFVLRYGPRHRYLGMVVLLGAWGVFMALRHSALHLARDVGQGFAAPVLGVHTYVWSWIIHFVVLVVFGVLLLLKDDDAVAEVKEPGRAARFAMALFMVVVGANAVQAITTTGPPPFMGQADPVRFSLNPRRWVWEMEELRGRISLRGSWTIPPPGLDGLDADPAHGPLAGLDSLPIVRRESLGVPLEDAKLADLARDPATGRFLAVGEGHTVTVLDSALSRVLHRVVLDHQFAVDLTPLAGAAFLGDTLAVVATNKSYVLLRPDPAADEGLTWRRFLESSGDVTELARSRFATTRARQMYVMSLAYDPAADELITVSVPSPRHQRMVISRFARSDRLLSSEFLVRFPEDWTLTGEARSPAEYYVTGAVVVDSLLYAVSAAYSTILAVDLRSRALRGAWAVPGLERPVGLTARGSELLVAAEDGRVAVVERPSP